MKTKNTSKKCTGTKKRQKEEWEKHESKVDTKYIFIYIN